MVLHKQIYFMLTLGLSVVIFLVIAVVVMALFCFVTRYFNKKLQKALDDQNQVYSMIQQIRGTLDNEDGENQYQNYVNKKQNEEKMGDKKNKPFQLEMTQVKQPLKGFGADDIYGLGRLKKRLQGQSIPLNPETGRSKTSLKSFRPDRLDSLRKSNVGKVDSNLNPDQNEDQNDVNQTDPNAPKKPRRKDKKKQNIVYHKYISKIVCYIQQGIFIVQNNMLSIQKQSSIVQKRNTKKSEIKPDQKSFEDTLEAYGFQKGTYCAFKFQTTLQVPHMKNNQQYPVASLKNTQSKEPIQFAEFYNLKDQLEENI